MIPTLGEGAASSAAGPGSWGFAVARRGYRRSQVDDYVARIEKEAQRLRAVLAGTQSELRAATQRAKAAESENRRLCALVSEQTVSPAAAGGFGAAAEKLLRMAELEAADIRARAVRDASDVAERAHAAAETSRHDVEQLLIVRAAALDEAAEGRTAELREKERVLAWRLDSVRVEAEQVRTAALRDADRLRRDAENEAEAVRSRLETEVGAIRERAQLDADRFGTVRNDACAEIERITRVLVTALGPQRYQSAGRPEARASA
jgi:cell division septum initiation protein DivIVA